MSDPSGRFALALLVGGLAVTLAIGGGVVAGTGAAISAPSDACAGVENDTVVVATPPNDGPIGPDGTVSVYAGSEVVVHLCQPPNGTRRLDPGAPSWATIVDESDRQLRVRVTAAPNESLGALTAFGTVPGPDLRIVGRYVESDLVAGPIPVRSEARATALAEAETAFLERERTLDARLATLATATTAVENGTVPNATAVRRVLSAYRAYRNATTALRTELYRVADSTVGGARVATAIVALETRSTAMENRTRRGIDAHDDSLRDREQSATWALRLRIVGLGLLGLAIGGVAGAVLPTRRGRTARRRLAVGEWTTYSRRAALLPAVVGVVLCSAGLGWLALEVGGTLVEVLLP